MNQNHIVIEGWSSKTSERLYGADWPDEPNVKRKRDEGRKCEACAHYGKFNSGFGLCCNSSSRHFTETVFERFTCPTFSSPSWPDFDKSAEDPNGLEAVYEVLSRRYDTGCHDLAERHNEHQP